MKKAVRRKLSLLLLLTVMTAGLPVQATTIEEAKEEAARLEEQKAQAKARQEEVKGKLEALARDMEKTATEIESTKKLIKEAEDELVAAKLDESRQYEDMKKRIRYMYENGQIQVFDVFAKSKDIGDMLNKFEYAKKISEYDRKKLEEFTKARELVEEKEKKLNDKYNELASLQDTMKTQKVDLEKTLEEANLKLSDLDQKIVENATELEKLIKAAEEAERIRKEKEAAERAAAERAAAQAAAAQSSSGGGYTAPTSPNVVSGNGYFTHPCPNMSYQSSYFGEIREFEYGGHKGNDYAAPTGTPTYAAAAGKVVIAGFSASAGNWVLIDHGNGLTTKYMHHSALTVSAGQYVEKGQQIGRVGSTGQSTGPHLHFQVEVNGVPVSPDTYL